MDWSEVNLERQEWIIPSARTKNKRDHLVPLTPAQLDILTSMEPEGGAQRGPVFTHNGNKPINSFPKMKKKLDAAMAEIVSERSTVMGAPVEVVTNWRLNDFRRSFATGCEGLKVPVTHTEAVLNHWSGSKKGIASVYHLHEYQAEKAEALLKWEAHLMGLLEADALVLKGAGR